MKKRIVYLLPIALIAIITSSCEKKNIDGVVNKTKMVFKEEIFTKTHNIDSTYNVNLSRKEALFISRIQNNKKSRQYTSIKDVNAITKGLDTLLHIINFTDSSGWIIISGDKRTPAIIAFSDNGNFNPENLNSAVSYWLTTVSESIDLLKKDKSLKNNSEELKFWKKRDEIVRQLMQKRTILTKGGGNEDDMWLQLVYTLVEFNDVQYDVPHLTRTKWGQNDPWNECIPYASANTRCATGCVAVAGAQMAYYLHCKIGKPVYAYSLGRCYGNPVNYDIQLSSLSSTIWDNMPLTKSEAVHMSNPYTISVCALMADVGLKVDMQWGEESSAETRDLKDYFSSYNIMCDYGSFNSEIVTDNIISDMPVIVRASSSSGNNGHSWIIDGVYVTRYKYIHYYEWMPRGIFPPIEPVEPDWGNTDKYVISDPSYSNYKTYYRMNWGWDGSSENNGLYLYGEDWMAAGLNFINDRKMLYNFR